MAALQRKIKTGQMQKKSGHFANLKISGTDIEKSGLSRLKAGLWSPYSYYTNMGASDPVHRGFDGYGLSYTPVKHFPSL